MNDPYYDAEVPVLSPTVDSVATPAQPICLRPTAVRRVGQAIQFIALRIAAGLEWLFGLVSLIVGLAVLATIPIVQLVSLGYLLESTGRIVRTGRVRDGLIAVRLAARWGGLVVGVWLICWPARLVAELWYSSLLLNGPGGLTGRWRLAAVTVTSLTAAHIVWAIARGGRLRNFLWPAPRRLWRVMRGKTPGWTPDSDYWQRFQQLRLGHLFHLGLRGAVGALVWLFVPISMLALAPRLPVPLGVFVGLFGGVLLATVLLYLPFLQARFAATGQMRDLFRVSAVRQSFARAPVAFWVALFATLALALPLYLLKAELIPREAAWLPSLVFVVFIWPARLLTGWAVSRSARRDTRRHFIFRWSARLASLPIALIYVLVVYFTQYVSWYGSMSLYEQHAFLLPVPFLGL